jgi:hypothetical protein
MTLVWDLIATFYPAAGRAPRYAQASAGFKAPGRREAVTARPGSLDESQTVKASGLVGYGVRVRSAPSLEVISAPLLSIITWIWSAVP